jgi:hypothetical protein
MKVRFIEAYQRRLTFEAVPPLESLEMEAGKEYDIEIKKHREKRSLNANAYCWVLCSKIAEKVNASKDEIYESMIQKYGYMDEELTVTVKAEVNMNRIDGHWRYITTSGDGKWKAYAMIRGSSKYNTAEMAHFIDMIIEEAKEIGVEIISPEEIERLKTEWEKWQGTKAQAENVNSQKS